MCNRKSNTSLWLLAAVAAPLAQTDSSSSWLAVLLVGGVCLGICWGLERIHDQPSPWLWVVQWFWLSLILGEFLHWTMYCWPDYQSYHAVPLVLLVLAAWLAGKGEEQASRAGSAMFWLLVLLFGAVLLSGAKEIQLENVRPVWQMKNAALITVILIPAMGIGLKGKASGRKRWILALGFLFAFVTTGVLTVSAAEKADSAFYEMSRSIRLLGTVERFESLVAAGMTMGYFVLLSFLLSTCAEGAEQIKQGKGRWGVWSNAVLTALWFIWGFRLSSTVLALGTMLTWVVLPVLNCIQRKIQKM